MNFADDWADYERANARAMRAYRLDRCASCGNLPRWNFGHEHEWLCDSCQRKERRKTG